MQEITIYGHFKNLNDEFLEELAELIEDNFDCELVGIGRRPAEFSAYRDEDNYEGPRDPEAFVFEPKRPRMPWTPKSDDEGLDYEHEMDEEAKNMEPDSEWRYRNWDYDG